MNLITPKMTSRYTPNKEKYRSSLVGVQILACKPAGIIRPKEGEPYEGEWLLVASCFGADGSLLDTKPIDELWTAEDAEPGLVRFYHVLLPLRTDYRKPCKSNMASYWLDVAPNSFDLYKDALEAWNAK